LLRIAIHSLNEANITVIHSRSQEAQVYADFCQPLRAFDSTLSFQPIPANVLSLPELTRAIRTANADIIALIRGGGSDEQFSMFENPDMLRAWSETRCAHVGTHNNTSRNCEHRNDQLRMQLRQVQMYHAARPLTPSPAPPRKEIPSQARQNAPTLLRLVLALLIAMLTGVILLPWFLHQR